MQRGFTKLFNTIVTSTIWQEDDKTRIVWITMLAIADQYGVVSASIPGLASVANVEIEAARKAVQNLEAPDPDSRTKDFDGRRIEPIDGGWRVLNYVKYRKMLTEEERKEYKAKWIREKRRQKSTNVDSVDGGRRCASASSSVSERRPKDLTEAVQYGLSKGISESDVAAFYDSMEAGGWTRGGKALKDWKAHLRSYKAQGWLPSQKKAVRVGPLLPNWNDRKAQKQLIDEVQEKKNEMFKLKQHRPLTTEEQEKYEQLSKRLEQLKSV